MRVFRSLMDMVLVVDHVSNDELKK